MKPRAWDAIPQEDMSSDQKYSPLLRLNVRKMVMLSSIAYIHATALPAARMQASKGSLVRVPLPTPFAISSEKKIGMRVKFGE